jgi:hypothetical protein
MSQPTLSNVAIDVVGQYHEAGKHLVRAYRVSTERAVGAVNERFAAVVNARQLPLVSDTVKARVIGVQQQVSGVVANGLSAGAAGADATIDRLSQGATTGIERLAQAGTKLEGVLPPAVIGTASSLAMPAAQVSLQISNFVAQGSKRLSDRVVGAEAVTAKKPARKAARKAPVKKTTARKTRTTRRA